MQYALSSATPQTHSAQLGLFQADTTNAENRLNELSLSGSSSLSLHLLTPMLRELSAEQGDRWLTLIAPPKALNRQWLRQSGVNRERILMLVPKAGQSALQLTERALRLGHSHTVVSFADLNSQARERLVNAATQGQSQALNVVLR